MKAEKPTAQQRIRHLIKNKSIQICQKEQKCEYYFQTFESMETSENSLIGKICGGIVVAKNQSPKQLILHLIVMYDHSKTINISVNKFTAFIKDYQLKADLSIFSYLNNFKEIQLGSFVNAWVRRVQRRENNTKILFELHLNRQPDSKLSNIKMGVCKDNVRIPESVLKVYEKEHTLPMNFQCLYYPNYDNSGLESTLQNRLKIDPIQSLHKVSNLRDIKRLGYNYNRVRLIQERQWRDEHLNYGLECIKGGRHDSAIECFNIAQKFDPQFVDIYIAKACAYMNMNNFTEGIKQIKQALKIDPGNERAKKYYEQFQRQYTKAQLQANSKRRSTSNHGSYEYVYKK